MSCFRGVILCFVLAGCGREPSPKAATPDPARDVIAAREAIGAPAEDTLSPVADVVAEVPPVVAQAEVVDKAHTNEPSVVTPLPQLCKEACANAHRLVLAELPVDTAKAMRDEVERALERDCPGRCLQRASLESARCFVGAKSALELAACPQ